MSYDVVKNPKHYTSGNIECIDAMISAFGVEAVKHFCKCNSFKYLWREENKNGIEDIEKAQWYMNKYEELSKETDTNLPTKTEVLKCLELLDDYISEPNNITQDWLRAFGVIRKLLVNYAEKR